MRFLSYINGVSYVFEGYMVNEFTYSIKCSPGQIVPFNEARDVNYQTCALPGNKGGSLSVESSDYLNASFAYSHTHIWRNVGIIIAFTILYIIPTVIASEILPFVSSGGGSTIFAPTKMARRAVRQSEVRQDDPEANAVKGTETSNPHALISSRPPSECTVRAPDSEDKMITRRDLEQRPIFTWKSVNYTVNGHRLLNSIDGYVKPGEMTVCDIWSHNLDSSNVLFRH
jgi:hypothetical protein